MRKRVEVDARSNAKREPGEVATCSLESQPLVEYHSGTF